MKTSTAKDDRVALITGGTRGIGRAIAATLARRGLAVAVNGRHVETTAAAARELAADTGGQVVGLAGDLTDATVASALVGRTVDRLGRLDILVNNAGIGLFAPVEDLPLEGLDRLFALNLRAPFLLAKAALPEMRRQGGGWIINISSLAGKNWFAKGSAYCASKAGLNAFSHALMLEARKDRIKVATIAPGSVATTFNDQPEPPADSWKLAPDDVAHVVSMLIDSRGEALSSMIEMRPLLPPSAR